MLTFRTMLLFGLILMPAAAIHADDRAEDLEFFEKKIRPVLVQYCYDCHSAETGESSGGLLLDTREGIRRGGQTGPAVVPQHVSDSLLISAIEYRDLEMPPDQRLSPEIIADFRRWIQRGAADPRQSDSNPIPEETTEQNDAQSLWSLQPVADIQPPTVSDTDSDTDEPQSDIDRFISARLQGAGLSLSDPAKPQVLLRRLSFALTGLPPTAQELQDFAADSSPAAVTQTVDRLLSSPHFGERWARHWLDVVRYGESAGSSRDVLMLHSWRYRDYVIQAFNQDLPYDEFIRQQVAGDLLPYENDEQRRRNLVATGMLAIGSKSLNGGNLELDIVDDQIDVVSKAMLGMTVSCARCHDHKFDPIPTADYYALAGIFRSTETYYGGNTKRPADLTDKLKVYLPLDENARQAAKTVQELDKQISAVNKQLKPLQKNAEAVLNRMPKQVRQQISQADADAEILADDQTDSKVARLIQQYRNLQDKMAEPRQQLKELQQQRRQVPEPEFAFGVQDHPRPRDYPIQIRGEKNQTGEVVPRSFLTCVPVPETFQVPEDSSGRLQLADWLTHPDNPLTARVMVNRVWQHLFGTGLVESVNNFGTTGSRPTHPQLLDWLAHRFVHHHHWSVKSLIREIVLSDTWQQSSAYRADAWEADPANQLLWRMNRRRLEAEAIRDAMLTASGELNPQPPAGSLVQQIGEGEVGRNINTKPLEKPFPHRSVYLPIIRGLLPEMLKVFDFPEPSNPSGQRTETNVPTQSLYLLNSEFVQRQAAGIAERVKQHHPETQQRLIFAWRTCLGRAPSETELASAAEFLQSVRTSAADLAADRPAGDDALPWQMLCQGLLASAEFRFLD